MKKILSLALAFLVIPLLQGCGHNNGPLPVADYSTHRTIQASPNMTSEYSVPAIRELPTLQEQPANAKEVKVGLLLPMTGPSAELGRSLLEAAQMGLFDKYASIPANRKRAQIVLMPKDTGGTPAGARKAAEEAAASGVKLLIGPVFSAEVKGAAPIAQKNDLRLITFSNNPEVAGEGVYLFGFAPDEQAKRVLREAFLRTQGRVGVLVPNNEYGKIVAQAAREIAVLNNKQLVGVELYEPTGSDLNNRIDSLLDGIDMKNDPQLDAVMLAEGAPNINNVLARLAIENVTNQNVALLGTGLWDDPSLLGNPSLVGGMFAGSPITLKHRFEDRYVKQYKHTPPRLASLAYDAVALAATIAETGDYDFTDASFTAPNGFSGPANGIFRFKDSGQIERGLAILAIGPKDFIQFAPSPASFQ